MQATEATTAQALVISRSCSLPGGKSGLMVSTVGCDRSVLLLPSDATTTVPLDCAKRIARRSAFQMARCPASFLQLNSQGSAK